MCIKILLNTFSIQCISMKKEKSDLKSWKWRMMLADRGD